MMGEEVQENMKINIQNYEEVVSMKAFSEDAKQIKSQLDITICLISNCNSPMTFK